MLVGRDRQSKMLIAHVVPFKGGGVQWMVDQLLRDIRKLGIHGKVILKGDPEASIHNVPNAVSKARGKDDQGNSLTIVERSPKGESQSNGLAERAVQEVEMGLRTHIIDLERKIGAQIEIDDPVVSWMVENIADINNKQSVGVDGRTPYERIKGKRHHGDFCEFGSQIFYIIPMKPQGSLMGPRCASGTWLGKRWNSDEHIIGMDDGAVVRTRAVRGKNSTEMWNAAAVRGVKGRPWDPAGTLTHEQMRQESTDPFKIPEVPRAATEEEETKKPVPRSFKLTEAMVKKSGATKGCPKCDAIKQGIESARTHSQACRRRITERVEEDEEYKGRKERADERANRYCESKNEDQDTEAKDEKEEAQEERYQDDAELPLPKRTRYYVEGGRMYEEGEGSSGSKDGQRRRDDEEEGKAEEKRGDNVEKRRPRKEITPKGQGPRRRPRLLVPQPESKKLGRTRRRKKDQGKGERQDCCARGGMDDTSSANSHEVLPSPAELTEEAREEDGA